MTKRNFIYEVIEKSGAKRPSEARIDKMVNDMSKPWQSRAEEFLAKQFGEKDYKFVFNLIYAGNCK